MSCIHQLNHFPRLGCPGSPVNVTGAQRPETRQSPPRQQRRTLDSDSDSDDEPSIYETQTRQMLISQATSVAAVKTALTMLDKSVDRVHTDVLQLHERVENIHEKVDKFYTCLEELSNRAYEPKPSTPTPSPSPRTLVRTDSATGIKRSVKK